MPPKRTLPPRRKTSARATTMKKVAEKVVERKLNKVVETKVFGMGQYNEQALAPTQVGSQTYYGGFVTGVVPSGWTAADWDILNLPLNQGDGAQEIIGNYYHALSTQLRMNFDMNSYPGSACPVEVRCVLFQPKKGDNPALGQPDPRTSLFLGSAGQEIGWATSGQTGLTLFNSNLNRRNYKILRDFNFIVQAPAREAIPGQSPPVTVGSQYGCTKRYKFNIPHNKKVRVQAGTQESGNITTGLMFLVRNVGQDSQVGSSLSEISITGTHYYKDA